MPAPAAARYLVPDLRPAIRAWIIPGAAAGLDWEDPKN